MLFANSVLRREKLRRVEISRGRKRQAGHVHGVKMNNTLPPIHSAGDTRPPLAHEGEDGWAGHIPIVAVVDGLFGVEGES